MKKWLAVCLVMALTIVPFAAFAEGTTMTPGKYVGIANGMKGEIKVEVEVDAASILSASVLESDDTRPIFNAASEMLLPEIVEKQSVTLDTVSGATISSYGLLSAVKDALKQAGAEKMFEKEKVVTEKTVSTAEEEYDVVIVGAGVAGISTALRLSQESDLRVLLLEKLAYPGGSALVCGGVMWVADTTDGANNFEQYKNTITAVSSTTEFYNMDLLEEIYSVSEDTFKNLLAFGLDNDPNLTVRHEEWGVVEYYAHESMGTEYYMTYDGGPNLTESIVAMLDDTDVELRCNAKVTALTSENGVANGVVVEGEDSVYTVRADHVVMATGGFGNNMSMVAEYEPEFANCFPYVCTGATGDGFALFGEYDVDVVGSGLGVVPGVSSAVGPYGALGNVSWTAQLYVNKEGLEYGVSTDDYFMDKVLPTSMQTGKRAYCICDSNYEHLDAFEGTMADMMVKKTDTIRELAEMTGIDADNLEKTAAEKGLTKAPFYSTPVVGLINATLTGVRVNENLQPLTTAGAVVPGVYAIGELAFGNIMYDDDPIPGNLVATSIYMGRIAADRIIESIAQ